MSIADKARFHLERAVPQLREFEEKKLFTKDEIRTLVSKRSSFEHLILAPRAPPSDFLTYASWEQSLETLRLKRAARLRVRDSKPHASHARTFSIFERGLLKNPGSLALWHAYLDFCVKIGATKRWRRVMARALRMHPVNGGLWVTAGRRSMDWGDVHAARGYFMRGARFCTTEEGWRVWVEYARCEMEWLGRMERKKSGGKTVLRGLEEIKASEGGEENGDVITFDEDSEEEEEEEGGLLLPDPEADGTTGRKTVDKEEVQKLETSPALGGAIPLAIFDIASKQPFFKAATAEKFFDVFAGFTDVSCQDRILQKVVETMEERYPVDAATCNVLVKRPLVGEDVHSAAFARALRESLARLKGALERTDDKNALVEKTIAWIEPILKVEGLDEVIRSVLEDTKAKLVEA